MFGSFFVYGALFITLIVIRLHGLISGIVYLFFIFVLVFAYLLLMCSGAATYQWMFRWKTLRKEVVIFNDWVDRMNRVDDDEHHYARIVTFGPEVNARDVEATCKADFWKDVIARQQFVLLQT
jgi:hypothetical protein